MVRVVGGWEPQGWGSRPVARRNFVRMFDVKNKDGGGNRGSKRRTIGRLRSLLTTFVAVVAGTQVASAAANVMNYGADGNDYFQFTTPSMAFDKASGFTTLITFAMHVDADGTLQLGGGPVCSNGVYVGPTNWATLITTLKTPPTTVNRYEVCIGGWTDTSFDNIKNLVTAQGVGPTSILYKNFQALKTAVPGIDAINDDDEQTYHLGSRTNFANMLGGLGFKYTLAPYTSQSFWVNLRNNITNCDYIYLQCYAGGAGNDPAQWNAAFGNGVKVIPGQESNTANPVTFRNWTVQTGVQGGFYYPDVVFNTTYWSAAIVQANGLAPATPTGLAVTLGGSRARVSWDVVPGAISYNVKRSTTSGAEVTITNLSTASAPWPASNQFFDTLPNSGVTNYYKVSAVNTNGESANSVEVFATVPVATAWFKADAISGLTNGALVPGWVDSSGHGFNASQSTIAQRPTILLGALNGLAVVHFEAASSNVLTLNRPVQDDFTIFCVFRSASGLGAGNQFDGGAGLFSAEVAGVTNDFGVGLLANGRVAAGVGNPDTSVNSLPGYNDGRAHLMTMRRTKSSGQVELFLDGNFIGSVTGSTNSLNAALKLALGAQQSLGNYFTGDLAELKIYNSPLSDTDRLTQESGLGQKWGVSGAAAGLLAYEGFDYGANSPVAGQFGGIGWSNAWVDVSGNVAETVNAASLPAGSNAPLGYDNRSAGNSVHIANNSRCGRWLDCSATGPFAQAGLLNGSGNIGANGKTVYVSFIQQPSSVGYFYEFEFHRDNLADAGRIAGIGNDVASSTQVNLRAPAATHTPMGVGSTNVNFYVVRIDFKSGNDDVYVYRNPKGNLESDNEPVLTMPAVADMSFDGLSMGAFVNGVTVKNDEIRVGQTWASAIGNPLSFLLQPGNQTLYSGQALALSALAQSSLPLNYQWYRVSGGTTNLLTNQTNASFWIGSVQTADAGQYFVTASNAVGLAVSTAATVTVQPVIVSIAGPSSLPLNAGDSLALNATVNGSEPLTLQWYKDGQVVAGANGATLAINPVDVFDAGQYLLVASNPYGSITSSIVNVFLSQAGLLAYEGFDYGQSGADVTGSSGGFGWGGPWQNLTGNSSQSFSNNLAGGINVPPTYDASSSGGRVLLAPDSRRGRFLDCSPSGNFAQRGYLNTNGDIGADGTTIYLSFLQQPNGIAKFYELEFHRGDLGDAGRMSGIGNDANDTNVYLRVQSPPGGTSTFYGLGGGSTNVNFYVVRIDFKAGNDDVFVYRNPTSGTEPLTPTLTVSNAGDLSFDGLSLASFVNGRTVAHDEVRVGATWADVIGKTGPSELQLVRDTNGLAQLRLSGAPNYTYQVQAATNLTGPWNNIGSVAVSSLGVGEFDEASASDQRFYRASNSLAWMALPSTNDVFADFEQTTYGAWVTTGTAFGSGPAAGTLPNQQTVSGYAGVRLVNSYLGSDTSVGTLTSPPFLITKPFITFLIGGGAIPGQECMNLIISNVVVRTATGTNDEALIPRQWDVSAYIGQTAVIQIVDAATGSWGHINVDQIAFADAPLPSFARQMFITNNLLNLPVQNSAGMRRVTVTVGGEPVRDFNIRLATGGTPDWWAFVDVSAFTNQTATLTASSAGSANDGFYSIIQTNGIVDGTNLYRETLRPQLHFSTKRGWLNDANAMFYHNGKYHLYYQHDPFDWGGGGQKWWGHAVSPDMVNWTEIQEGLYPYVYGDQVYSGSGIVDTANTGGFKTGTNDVIVVAFTSTARGECIDYSNDGGLTFTEITNNPVVAHNGRDPHLLWYAPSNYWVMAVYDESGAQGISFYTSANLRQWTFRSKINGYFECPDIYQLPVDGNTNNMMWLLCDASSGYQLGQFNGVMFTPSTSKLPGNSGAGFYASQTFTSMAPGDNRLVRIGWAIISTPGMPFNQLMYFPTELNLRTTTNGVRLCSTPIAEITNNIVTSYAWTNLTLSPGSNPLAGVRGMLFDVKAQFSVGTAQSVTFTFQGTTVTYNAATQQISCNGVVNTLGPIGGSIQLEIIADRKTIEIFGNNGQLYMPVPADNAAVSALISIGCSGGNATFNSLTVNKLRSIWTGATP